MPEESRVFDVTRPSHVNPSATSKPVIVGHRPEMSDPMVKEQAGASSEFNIAPPEPTRIPVSDSTPTESTLLNRPPAEPAGQNFAEPTMPPEETPIEPDAEDLNAPTAFSAPAEHDFSPSAAPNPQPELPAVSPVPDIMAPADQPPHVEELHFAVPRRRRKWPWFLLLLLAILVGAYLAIDSGLIKTSISLPVHVFKQKTNTTNSTPPTASQNNASTPAIPTGFKAYKLAGTSIIFAAPMTWGDPTSSTEPGYSKRGGTNQSDGTYAYLVTFATNKDVELAVTSSKYLPAARATLYYDYLQWCVGTNDGKYYESILHFTTDPTTKIATPTTITCDQGPVPSAVKLDNSTIIQPKAQDTAGKTIGDIYTKNLTDSSLVVFRVKDAAMTNGDNIKQLLGTVQMNASSSSSSSGQ